MIFEPFNPGRCGNLGGRATKNHHTSHIAPSPPVIQNAVRQPNANATGVTSSGASSEPEAAPL